MAQGRGDAVQEHAITSDDALVLDDIPGSTIVIVGSWLHLCGVLQHLQGLGCRGPPHVQETASSHRVSLPCDRRGIRSPEEWKPPSIVYDPVKNFLSRYKYPFVRTAGPTESCAVAKHAVAGMSIDVDFLPAGLMRSAESRWQMA